MVDWLEPCRAIVTVELRTARKKTKSESARETTHLTRAFYPFD